MKMAPPHTLDTVLLRNTCPLCGMSFAAREAGDEHGVYVGGKLVCRVLVTCSNPRLINGVVTV